MVEEAEGKREDHSEDIFDGIQEDDGASDDETDSFKAASEQAYKQHLEEQSRRQSLRPRTAPTRPQTPSSADRKRRAVEQQDERFRFRPETPRVDYVPPRRPITGPEIDHAAWGFWLSPGCSYTQLMGPISNRPATAYAPRKVTESLDWRDVVGRQDKGRQPWQDVKPCDVNGASKDANHRQPYGEEPQFAAAATPRQTTSPYLSGPKYLRRPFSASVADKRRKMQNKGSPSAAVRESPLRRRKESAGMRIDNPTERSGAERNPEVQNPTDRAAQPPGGAEPNRLSGNPACDSDARADCNPPAESAAPDSGPASGSPHRAARHIPFMASIEERLQSMSIAASSPGAQTSKPVSPDTQSARPLVPDVQTPSRPVESQSPAELTNSQAPRVDGPAHGNANEGVEMDGQNLDVRIPPTADIVPPTANSVRSDNSSPDSNPRLETEAETCALPASFPARPFTAGVARRGSSDLNPPNHSRPATAPVKPCVPSLSESFSRMGLGNAAPESGAVSGRSDLYRNPLSSRSSAGKAPSAYTRRVMAPPQFVQLTPWDANIVEDVLEKVTEANKLSRAIGLSVRYNMFQNGKKDVWVEVYEARTLVKHKGSDTSSLERREWRETIEDPAEAAAQSATRNPDAGDPADEFRGSKLRDVSVDVFLRTHRRLQKAATDARFRGFLSLAEPEPEGKPWERHEKDGEGKKELWEELGVNEGFAKILTKAREQVIQNKHSIASSGRDTAVRGRLIGSTAGLIEITNPLLKGPRALYDQSKTSTNVAKAMGTFSAFGLAMAQRDDMGRTTAATNK